MPDPLGIVDFTLRLHQRAFSRLPSRVLLAAAALAAAAHPLHAQDRMIRRYAAGQGFNGAPVFALAQDVRGFLWIGGQGGLYRYDGTEFRRWAAGGWTPRWSP